MVQQAEMITLLAVVSKNYGIIIKNILILSVNHTTQLKKIPTSRSYGIHAFHSNKLLLPRLEGA